MQTEAMGVSCIFRGGPSQACSVHRQPAAVEPAVEVPQRTLRRQNCFKRRRQKSMIACLGNGERAQGQQKPSSGDLEGFSLAGSAEERHEGNEESIKSSAEDMLESENDENNGNGGDSDNLTPFSEKKSSQELLRVESLKSQLLAKTIGLDTGFSANDSQIAMICNLADELEAAQGTTPFEKSGKEFTLNALDGVWQLVFSSAFKNGNLGGNQPGPFSFQLLGSPISLERVFQRICVQKRTLDNIVVLKGAQLPQIPLLPNVSAPNLRLSLMHDFIFSGPANIEITFRDSSLELLNSGKQIVILQQPSFLRPLLDFLRSSAGSDAASAEFVCSFCDESMRITKGDRGELRVFVKDDSQNYC